MDRQNNTKSLVESGILSGVAVVVALIGMYVPFAGLVSLFVLPAISAYLFVKHGEKYGIVSTMAIFIICLGFFGPIATLIYIGICEFYGLALGFCIKTKKSVPTTIIILSIVVFLTIIIDIEVFSLVSGGNIISQGINIMNKSYESTKSIYMSMGVSRATLDKAMASVPSAKDIFALLPAAIIMASVLSALIGYIVIQKMFKRFKYNIPEMKPLSEWYIPVKIAFGVIIIFGISFFLSASGYENGNNYLNNAYLILGFTFTVNGLGFISSFLKKRRLNKAVITILMILFIMPPIGNYLYLVGIFDYMMDFRKLDPGRKRPIE